MEIPARGATCSVDSGLSPRKNSLLKAGNKNDRIDARKLADLLRTGLLSPVYHGENGLRTLRELARSYLVVTRDLTRVMNRLKALYRSWAIPCAGRQVYAPRYRSEWLSKISEAGVRRRAEFTYQQFDALDILRQEVRRDLLAERRRDAPTPTIPPAMVWVVLTGTPK
jgi:Transposase